MDIRQAAAHDAVINLGLLRPTAIETIVSMIQDPLLEHPQTVTTSYRKGGEQIPNDAKKALGIRVSGFLSVNAYEDLSEFGLIEPLAAHERTLLRANSIVIRQRQLDDYQDYGSKIGRAFVGIEHSTSHRECEACNTIDAVVTAPQTAHVFPPPGCRCTASYILKPKIDWFADVD